MQLALVIGSAFIPIRNYSDTLYSDWRSISLVAEKLKQGSYVITASQILQSALFEVVKSEQVKTSWGTAKIYIHVMLTIHHLNCSSDDNSFSETS